MTTLADRVIVVLYMMAGGEAGVPVPREEWFAECERLNVARMTEEQFKIFHQGVLLTIETERKLTE